MYTEVSSGQVSGGVVLSNWDYMCIYSGGSANKTVLNSDGILFVSNGGAANSVTVNRGGSLCVEPGGTALNVKWTPCVGEVELEHGAKVTFTSKYSGVYYGSDNKLLSHTATMTGKTVKGSGFSMCVMNGGTINRTTVSGYNEISVFSGGTANSTTLYGGDKHNMYVYSGGVANNTTVNDDGYLKIKGGKANNVILNDGGHMRVSSGGKASNITVNRGGSLKVSSGGSALNVRWTPCVGKVEIKGGAKVTFADKYSGVYYGSKGKLLSHATVMTGKKINDDAIMYVMNGGTANKTVNTYKETMFIYSGGVANSTTARGELTVGGGGKANSTVVAGGYGYMDIEAGGTANKTTINSDGGMYISRGGVANSTTLKTGGYMYISSGGRHNGQLNIGKSATMSVYKGGIIDFSLAGIAPGAAARINDLSRIDGTPNYYVTVSEDQKSGTYTLAGGAAKFKGTITVYAAKSKLGTITVGKTLASGDGKYTLTKSDDKLLLKIVVTGPDAPTVKASTAKATNKNITITAAFAKNSAKKQYSTDNKSWKDYTGAITVAKNGTYYFRAVGKNNRASEVTTYKVTNIDKTAPKTPTVKASTTKATNQDVTVTATFSTDSAKKQYSTDNKTWKTYSKALTATKNGTYYFRGVDAAGNISKVTSLKVANIDKTAPNAPTVKVNTTNSAKSVTITATYSNDSAKKQYSTDKKTWKTYSKALSVNANGMYYFRGIDAAGNKSAVKTVMVDNIVNTGNNNWSNATALDGEILAAVDKSLDKLDCYAVDPGSSLLIYMERGKIKATFLDEDRHAVECTTYNSKGQEINLSSFEIAHSDDPEQNSRYFHEVADEVRYLKIEALTSGVNSYHLVSELA